MRLDPLAFEIANNAVTKEPVFVIELAFDKDNTDLYYMTSEPVSGLTDNVFNNTLSIVSGTSQRIDPERANATIGSMRFKCLDFGLTELQRAKLNEDKGLKKKRVRLYAGFKGWSWVDFQLVQTQVIDRSVEYKDGEYTFHCSDIQRALRDKLFIVKQTNLSASITSTQDTLPVLNTSGFETVYQVPSTEGKTLLRSLQQTGNYPVLDGLDHNGLLLLKQGDDIEIALWTGKTANTFTGVVRGVLGTKPLDIDISGADSSSLPEVKEYVYLDMPAVKAAYAIMTGSLYGHPGEFLPDHWHLGISTDYVKTSDFVNIGADMWDLSDDDKGYPISIRGEEDIDGKKFLEQQLFYALGIYAPVLSTGELGLRRLRNIGPTGSYDRYINEDAVTNYGALRHNQSAVVNTIILKWNWDETREIFTRTSILEDPLSQDRHTETEPKIVELKTLHGSRHSDHLIQAHFDALRSRYAGPPLELNLDLMPGYNNLEVGDIVRVNLSTHEDYSSELNAPLNRNFEVQSVGINWLNGDVKVKLFASSQRASDVTSPATKEITSVDLFVTDQGTEINSVNFPGAVSSSGGVTTVTGDITLTGDNDLTSASATYFCNEDLTINASAVVTTTLNTQIRVNGFTQVNGEINGEGNGLPGGVADTVASHVQNPVASNLGQVGIGNTAAAGGWNEAYSDGYINENHSRPRYTYHMLESQAARNVTGISKHLEKPILKLTGALDVEGLPSSLMGTSGSSGAGNMRDKTTHIANGGNGGASGAGLVIFSKGIAFGASGKINLSGDDGLAGSDTPLHEYPGFNVRAGGGAGGAPGGFLLCMLDSSQSFPIFNSGNLTLEHGLCPENYTNLNAISVYLVGTQWRLNFNDKIAYDPNFPASSYENGGGLLKQRENTWDQNAHIVFLDIDSVAVEDEPQYVQTEPTFTLTEQINTPVTPEGDKSTIEVSVTPPGDTNYSYSLVEYRESGSSSWKSALPASNESLIEVASDGKTYEVRIRAVSKAGKASPSGEIQSIAITDINGRSDAELALIYPFHAITDLALQNSSSNETGEADFRISWSAKNNELAYFAYYEIEVRSGGSLIRTERSVSPFYEYPLSKNAADYKEINQADGAYYDFDLYVKAVSKHYNSLGNLYAGDSVTLPVTISPPPVEEVTLTYSGTSAVISVAELSNSNLNRTVTLSYQGSIIQETKGNIFVVPVDWEGSRSFELKTSFIPGHTSAPVLVQVNPAPPSSPVVSSKVISNTVTFNYESTAGALPIDRYEIRKGSTYNQGTKPETKPGSSSFTLFDEIQNGTIVYWFEAVDTAGNRSVPTSISVIVSTPDDYQLLAEYSEKAAGWPGAKTNCMLEESNALILPVVTTETWAEHFTNNSYNSPQEQINDGKDYYLQPSTNTAQYVVSYDYGVVLSSSIITANVAPVVLDGSIVTAVHIEYSEDNVVWNSGGAGQTQVMGSDFRYVRVTMDFTATGGDDLATVQDILITLDKKLTDDSGKFTANAGDATGTRVYFNKDYLDAQTPSVSISSTEIIDVVVDFNDIPEPEYFDVYVFRRSDGQRLTASGSWTTKGFARAGT